MDREIKFNVMYSKKGGERLGYPLIISQLFTRTKQSVEQYYFPPEAVAKNEMYF